jgi:hypothetical protein
MLNEYVYCKQCGSESRIVSRDGELNFRDPNAKPRIVLTIDCPKCGKCEQPETPVQR